MQQRHEIATLAGGCFWCPKNISNELRGVEKVVSGYSGGRLPNSSYQMVCIGETCHAEAVQITFDPLIISFKELLEVFFTIRDPTTLDRLGMDAGTQYRSAVFFQIPGHEAFAGKMITRLEPEKIWDAPFVTEITPFKAFYPVEEYHNWNPDQMYCRAVISPKLAKFSRQYFMKLKKG